jgi:hypothetical protein
MSRDDEHLDMLAVFHNVVAGLALLVALFPSVHLFVGLCLVSGYFTDPKPDFPFALVGWFFVLFASCWIVAGLTFAFSLAWAGRCLRRRRRYPFCLVMAGLACAFMPFGTVLGVFTIVTLTKESVKAQFQPASAPAPR